MTHPLARVPEYPKAHDVLRDRVVVVTAAAGTGIGSATARRCLEEGARVVVSDRHERRLAETRDLLAKETGGEVVAVACDVTAEEQVQALFDATVAEFGRLDVLVNNAGLGGTALLEEMGDDEWARVIDVTLTGTMRCTRAALRRFRAQLVADAAAGEGAPRGGAIVHNASVLGWRAQAGQAHFAAATAGVMALTRCTAEEAAELGVRVNAVAPSLAMHPFLAKVTSDEVLDDLVGREAFGRAAEPWEVANVIVFLASAYAGYLTGEVRSVRSQHP